MTTGEGGGPKGKLTLDDLDRFLGAPREDPRVEAYRDAAAVLAAFDPLELRPAGAAGSARTPDRALDALLPVSEPAAEASPSRRWTLVLPERRAALQRMTTRENMRRVLEANPERIDTPLQRMFERILREEPIPLSDVPRDDLVALLTVDEWLEGILDNLPDAATVRKALAYADLLAPMRRLAGSDFVGRDAELRQLADYVFGGRAKAPLFVFGTGGVGKSTLLARFILQHVAPQHLPVVYLDIDRPALRPEEPLTLLFDAIGQFRPQLDWMAESAEPVVKEIAYRLSGKESGRAFESGPDYGPVLDLFARIFTQAAGNRVAVLIVDTIEEAQFLGPDVVWGLMDFVFRLEQSVPSLRVVLSGRTLPEEYVERAFPGLGASERAAEGPDWLGGIPLPERPINLGVLDDATARELLRRALRDAGVPALHEDELTDVIGIVTGNPMCLKLAARLLRDEGVDKLRADRTQFLARLKAEKIQGLLYGRILRNLHGDDVRQVAYPGLVVRRIDPEVIRTVLAGPCKLQLTPERNEQAIFDALGKEAALLEVDPDDGSLRHRTDVRRVMLQDLTDHVDADTVAAIDGNAIAFYDGRPGVIARAEEIYHRLRRGDPPAVLEPLWIPGVAPRLKSAIEELPARQQLWLASRLDVTLGGGVREDADQDAWEEQAARSADRFLQSRSPDRALAVLQEREARSPRSALYALEAEAHRFLGRFDEALAVARRGVESMTKAGAIDRALELLLKMAVIEESRQRLPEAEAFVDEALGFAAHTANRLLWLRAETTKLRLQRQLRPSAREERASLRSHVQQNIDDDMLHALRSQPVLLREVAAELSKQDPRLAALALETLGIEVGSDAQAQALGRAVATLEKSGRGDVFKGTMPILIEQHPDASAIRQWVTEHVTSSDTRRLSSAVAEGEGKVLSGFRNYFRAGVESTLRGGV